MLPVFHPNSTLPLFVDLIQTIFFHAAIFRHYTPYVLRPQDKINARVIAESLLQKLPFLFRNALLKSTHKYRICVIYSWNMIFATFINSHNKMTKIYAVVFCT